MNNSIDIQVRVFPVIAVDERTGVKSEGSIVLTKPQLQAAALVGWDYKTLIYSIYNKQGYKVTFIGKPAKKPSPLICTSRMTATLLPRVTS